MNHDERTIEQEQDEQVMQTLHSTKAAMADNSEAPDPICESDMASIMVSYHARNLHKRLTLAGEALIPAHADTIARHVQDGRLTPNELWSDLGDLVNDLEKLADAVGFLRNQVDNGNADYGEKDSGNHMFNMLPVWAQEMIIADSK